MSLQIDQTLTQVHAWPDHDALAQALAAQVADDLRAALAERGRATVALSGGTTPVRFFQALAEQPLPWKQVTITLVDERWVDESNARSNAALVRQHLMYGAAAVARFVPLYRSYDDGPEAALPELEAELAQTLPLDVAVLGMGTDGHTASFFPGGDYLAQALDPAGTARVLPMHATAAGEARITLTLPVLAAARHLYLHIEGEQKARTLQEALAAQNPPPIAVMLRAASTPVQTYWCP
ncbi:6-phosphogluconolactonase [Pseudoxanthomonas winnipegensis]|uniref:6-phosphogluconolactonase n=1 Tax=Pseudoxanthomonas winnipegensis TaxID=2480810 RepID=A0A4Q8LNY1_9GAMM|nr:6-phosphogluconolactonase [Pseudoxanthomonas winnipegensis]RZZ89641.1 6-phosphogluconolactonase [Pseudoxanthomonas winnipegensis]TAA32918.1 6-phosphogluconolactonase [Pseudoxanthomonas winnipegensis]TAA43162.1 6-phosphogluconolactonase [Pseudoxanthomonas winnipegensis]TBV78599.1 6-phosphogluconolactonase [Pseudoxanthomonas winnipegensis]